MKHLKKTLLTLVALFAMTTGAWAVGIRGDVNADGVVDVADIAAIISVMNEEATYAAADVNTDGSVNVGDIAEVNAIIAGQDGKTSAGTKVVLKAADINVANGEEKDIVINMDYETSDNIIGLAFSLYLPDGILLKGFDTKEAQDAARASALKNACDLGDNGLWGEDGSNQRLTVMQKSDGGLLFVFLDQNDKEKFISTKAMALTISVHAVADVAATASIKNISITSDQNASIDCGAIANAYFGINQAAVPEPVGPAAPTVPLTWDATAKTATLTNGMPAGNVTVSVEYFPQATMADGAVTAATDAKATTDEALVTVDAQKLTGATKLMYFVSETSTAPAYDAEGWTDDVPTAADFTEAKTVYVWYYPVGADDEDPAKTYSDGDMNATALAVTLLPEPTYNVTFAEGVNPEPPADPIWTATPNTDVKKGDKVTVTYTGDRKVIGVKAEKKAESTLAAALKDGAIVTITYGWGSYTTILTYTNNGGTFSCNITGSFAGDFESSSTLNDKSFTLSGWHVDMMGDTKFSITFNAEDGTYVFNEKGSEARSFNFSLNGVDITSQLTECK